MMDDSTIAVTNVVPGEHPVIVRCDVTIDSITVHGVTLRRGRQPNSTYVNMPAIWRDGEWRPIVEITDLALRDEVRQAVIDAAMEATRYMV